MKFSSALFTSALLCFVSSSVARDASLSARYAIEARQNRNGGNKGGNGGNNGGDKGGNGGGNGGGNDDDPETSLSESPIPHSAVQILIQEPCGGV
jgi:hypothetical protein